MAPDLNAMETNTREVADPSMTIPLRTTTADSATSFIEKVVDRYPPLTNEYFADLCRRVGAPLLRQVTPDWEELSAANETLPEDPIGEDAFSPVPNLTHRYKDRVLLLVSDRCPIHCRFCTRKRKVGTSLRVTENTLDQGISYIAGRTEVRDVLLSGGDPLMLADGRLGGILGRLRALPHVQILRIGTRVPCALPARVTLDLARLLSEHHPLYIHTHFNHPAEITVESRRALRTLADAGIPLNNQTVLLKGVNDDPETLEALFSSLLALRVRPYYLFQVDLVRGTGHFRVPLEKGLAIMEELRRRMSPMGLPVFTVDLPQAAGKVAVSLGNTARDGDGAWEIRTPEGRTVKYRDPDGN